VSSSLPLVLLIDYYQREQSVVVTASVAGGGSEAQTSNFIYLVQARVVDAFEILVFFSPPEFTASDEGAGGMAFRM